MINKNTKRRHIACLLVIMLLFTQYISPYAQFYDRDERQIVVNQDIGVDEDEGITSGDSDRRNRTATTSDAGNSTVVPEEEIEEDDEIPIYDDRFDDVVDLDTKTASPSNAGMEGLSRTNQRDSGVYLLKYRAIVDGQWQIIYEEEVSEGEDGSPPEVPYREGYTFAGWNRSYPYVNVRANRNINATYVQGDVELHVVNYLNADGRLLVNPEYVQNGTKSSHPGVTAYKREGYTFLGWDKEFYDVTEDMEIRPRYLEGEHTVYWLIYRAYYKGSTIEIKYEAIPEGEDASPPEVPDREGYTFAGWNRSYPYVNVRANRNINATYVQGDVELHVVNYLNADGRLLVNPEYVQDGTKSSHPGVTAYKREGYTFLGWDKEFYDVTEDMEIRPRYLEGEHTVYWLIYRAYYKGSTIEIKYEAIPEGEDASPPEVPEREGYTFAGWDRSYPYVNVRANRNINATYVQGDVELHVVNYLNADGRLLVNSEYVQNGTKSSHPGVMAYKREGYTFLGWDKEFYDVTEDMEIRPRYLEGEHTVYWLIYRAYYKGSTIEIKYEAIPEGEDASPPEVPNREGYTFAGWDRSYPYVNVRANRNINATYIQGNVEMHIVRFVNASGSLIVNPEYVQKGKGATHPSESLYKREGYTFLGLNQEFYNVTKPMTVRPRYLEGEHKVHKLSYQGYYNNNSTMELKREWVLEGGNGSPPEVPARAGWTFTGWSRSYPYINVTASRNIYATYLSGTYTTHKVSFVDFQGNLIENVQYIPDGRGATTPSLSLYQREGYTFLGWNQDFYYVKGDLTVKPRYAAGTHKTYKVLYHAIINNSWNYIRTEYVIQGNDATLRPAPDREGYEFAGWGSGGTNITRDTTLTAQYERIDTHTVTFMIEDQVIKTVTVNHGARVAFPTDDEIRESGYLLPGDLEDYGIEYSRMLSSRVTVVPDYPAVFTGWKYVPADIIMSDEIIYGTVDPNILDWISGKAVKITYKVENEIVYSETLMKEAGEDYVTTMAPALSYIGLKERDGYTFHWNISEYGVALPGDFISASGSGTIYGEYQKDYTYDADDFNTYVYQTNCYAYAFDWLKNPVNGEFFGSIDSESEVFAMQPGLFNISSSNIDDYMEIQNKWNLKNRGVADSSKYQKNLLNYIKQDARTAGYSFESFKSGMSGGHRVLLFTVYQTQAMIMEGKPVVKVIEHDYHWWRLETGGTWSNKHGASLINHSSDVGITVDSEEEAVSMTADFYGQSWGEGVTVKLIGCYYIKGE